MLEEDANSAAGQMSWREMAIFIEVDTFCKYTAIWALANFLFIFIFCVGVPCVLEL